MKSFMKDAVKNAISFLEKEGDIPPQIFAFKDGKVNVAFARDRYTIRRAIDMFRSMDVEWIVVLCLAKFRTYANPPKKYRYGQVLRDPVSKECLYVSGTTRDGQHVAEFYEIVKLENGRYKVIKSEREELKKIGGFLTPDPW